MSRIYPYRYTNEAFDRFNEMYNDPEIRENCNKWKEGINPYTNRKIKIGGKTYDSIKDDFMIYFLYGTRWTRIFYLKLNIDQEMYKEETIQLNNEIDRENEVISSKIEQIKCLKSWNDFVIYDGMKYGLKTVLNNIHRENDCFGKMECYMKKHKCKGCRNGHTGYQCLCDNYTMNKCNKCGYEERESA